MAVKNGIHKLVGFVNTGKLYDDMKTIEEGTGHIHRLFFYKLPLGVLTLIKISLTYRNPNSTSSNPSVTVCVPE